MKKYLSLASFIFLGIVSIYGEKSMKTEKIEFIYVHGFGEWRFPTAFDTKGKEYVKDNKIEANVSTYYWDSKKLNPFIVLHQWEEAKKNADKEAKVFYETIINKFEKENKKYVLIGYSLGSRVITKSFNYCEKKLKNLAGVYFLGAAQDKDLIVDRSKLPDDLKIINYYSSTLDTALKLSYSIAEGKVAGGEVGFSDLDCFENYRTVCTHVYKGGPIQRDYSNLSGAIIDITLFNEKISKNIDELNYNIEMKVGDGLAHWNDLLIVNKPDGKYLFQHNVNTNHYRTVLINTKGERTRKGWSVSLYNLLNTFVKNVTISSTADLTYPNLLWTD